MPTCLRGAVFFETQCISKHNAHDLNMNHLTTRYNCVWEDSGATPAKTINYC